MACIIVQHQLHQLQVMCVLPCLAAAQIHFYTHSQHDRKHSMRQVLIPCCQQSQRIPFVNNFVNNFNNDALFIFNQQGIVGSAALAAPMRPLALPRSCHACSSCSHSCVVASILAVIVAVRWLWLAALEELRWQVLGLVLQAAAVATQPVISSSTCQRMSA